MKEEIENLKNLYEINLTNDILEKIELLGDGINRPDVLKMHYLIGHLSMGVTEAFAPCMIFDDGDKRIVVSMSQSDLNDEIHAFGEKHTCMRYISEIFDDIEFTKHYRKVKINDLLC